MARLCFFMQEEWWVMQGGQVGVSQPHDIPLSQLPGMHFIIFFPLGFEEKGRIRFCPRALSCSWAL